MTSSSGQKVVSLHPLGHRHLERTFGPFARLALLAILVPAAEVADREIAEYTLSAHRHGLERS